MSGLFLHCAAFLVLSLTLGSQTSGNPPGVVPEICPFCTSACRNITVSQNGTNGHKCLTQSLPFNQLQNSCRTLAYVLMNLKVPIHGDQDCIVVMVNYSHDFNHGVYIHGIQNLAIIGARDVSPVLHCSQGSGISFEEAQNIWIENTAWEECSLSHQLPLPIDRDLNGTSALFFYMCINITLTSCRFSSKEGSGVFMWNVGHCVHVTKSNFTNNITPVSCPNDLPNQNCVLLGGGLYIDFDSDFEPISPSSRYTISSCYFANNSDGGTGCKGNLLQMGTTLSILVPNLNSNISVAVTENTFQCNVYSCYNGDDIPVHAISIITLDTCTNNTEVLVDGNTYLRNNGSVEAAALAIYMHNEHNCNGNAHMKVSRCNFTENSAVAGTVTIVVDLNQQGTIAPIHGEVIRFENCYWYANTASSVGIAVTLFTPNGVVFNGTVTFENCKWENNTITPTPALALSAEYSSLATAKHFAVLLTEGVSIFITGSTMFKNHLMTALLLYCATVKLNGDVTFVNNIGTFGGAAYLGDAAWIVPLDNLYLKFENNSASFGGAIYSKPGCDLLATSNCTIFGFNNGTKICPDNFPQNTTISFINNTASISGNSIYLENNCQLDCLHGSVFLYYPNDISEVAGLPEHIQFNVPAVLNQNQKPQMSVILGQNIFLNVTTFTSDYNNSVIVPTAALVRVYMKCIPNALENVFILQGPSSILLDTLPILLNSNCGPGSDPVVGVNAAPLLLLMNRPFYSDIEVKGPEITNHSGLVNGQCGLRFVTVSQPPLVNTLYLDLLPCKPGYIYDSDTQKCQCFDSEHIYCNVSTLEVCIEYGYWYGLASDAYTVDTCPSGLCKYSYGNCPVGSCTIFQKSKPLPGFCRLADVESAQCSENRGGVLCTGCITNYSFTFGAIKCVENSTCSAFYIVLPVLLLLVFWAVMILTILLVLRLNLRLGSGYLYAFIYYFSVVRYVLPAYLPSRFLDIVVTVFVSMTNLNPVFIGEIPVCFVESMSSIEHQFFQYVHPLLIALAIFIAIVLARFFPRLPNPAKNSAIHAICILILLSFSSLVETSFNLLNPVKLEYVDRQYVNIQADTEFFDPEKHLAFAVIAILVLVLIIFPFMLLMFLSPVLMRCGVNLTKIKPILDNYQACYKDKWRWVAGFYFLCRMIVFFISKLAIGVYGNTYILQIFFLLTAVLHTAFQPYATYWLDLVDATFLLDIAMISLLYGKTADLLFSDTFQSLRDSLLHVLILIPCLYFIGCLIYLLLTRTGLEKYVRKYRGDMQPDVTTQSAVAFSTASSVTDDSLPNVVYDNRDREPLLFLLSDNGALSASTYQAIHHQQQLQDSEPENQLQTIQQWQYQTDQLQITDSV